MFRNLFYSFGFLVFISATWAMEGKTDDGDGWLGNLPVMVRRDARQFQEAVHFSDLPDNPYAAYFQGALIGKVFHGGAADSDATINGALVRLVTPGEAKGVRAYFKKSFDVGAATATRQSFLNHRQNLNGWHTAFKNHFDGTFTGLSKRSNAFALFVKGFMLYDHGVVNHNDDEKNHGEQYLQHAANLYCLPALNFLEWLSAEKGHTKLAAIVKQKKDHCKADALKGGSADVIRYVIQESMFDTLLAPSSPSCCGCQRKKGTAVELSVANPAEHFAESFLEAFGTLNRTFYGEALAHLNKTVGSMRRTAYLTTQSRFWFATSIVTPFVTMGINAAQLWSGYQTMPAGTPQDAQDIISTLTRNALGSLVTSTITFSYGAWVLYKSSDIVKLNTDVLRDQCILTALYLTVNKGTGAIAKAGETEGEGVINRWFQETTGFRLFSKKQTLSQRILNRR